MVLNRNLDNFFAETEQVAFHPGNLVPGIEFSGDALLQRRLFTQLSRLGGANFHEIPVYRPRCPMRNFQRDGMRRIEVPKGRRVAGLMNSTASLLMAPMKALRLRHSSAWRFRLGESPRALRDIQRPLQPGSYWIR